MMRVQRISGTSLLLAFLIAPFSQLAAQGTGDDQFIEKVKISTMEVAARSFPEIERSKFRFKLFESESNFFKARFSIGRFLSLRPMRHLLFINPSARTISDEALEGVVAHELAHILFYTEKNRFELLGLVCLASPRYTTKFERKADLVAIERGYGPGLRSFREWLYRNISDRDLAAKKRAYFTPEEIDLLLKEAVGQSGVMEAVNRSVPKDIDELRRIIEIAKN